jgi:hypothetical protein
MIQYWLENEIGPLLHLKILDGDDDGCLVSSTMIEEDHKPFSFLLQQQTSQMSKNKKTKSPLSPRTGCIPRFFELTRDFFQKNR